MSLKDKMTKKDKTLIKLVLWAGVMVWMLMYLAFGIAVAKTMGSKSPEFFSYLPQVWIDIISWALPVWFIFTILLTIVLVARWTYKKMGRTEE